MFMFRDNSGEYGSRMAMPVEAIRQRAEEVIEKVKNYRKRRDAKHLKDEMDGQEFWVKWFGWAGVKRKTPEQMHDYIIKNADIWTVFNYPDVFSGGTYFDLAETMISMCDRCEHDTIDMSASDYKTLFMCWTND